MWHHDETPVFLRLTYLTQTLHGSFLGRGLERRVLQNKSGALTGLYIRALALRAEYCAQLTSDALPCSYAAQNISLWCLRGASGRNDRECDFAFDHEYNRDGDNDNDNNDNCDFDDCGFDDIDECCILTYCI